jgi:hypothetical protein
MPVMSLVRYWLPGIVIFGGVLVMIIGRGDNALIGGAGIIGAGLSIWLLNLLYRMGAIGDRERDQEEAARAFFDAHGYWPDERPPSRERPVPAPHKTRPPHEQHVARPPRRREDG